MARTPDQIVAAEVHYCVSYLVSTLAKHDSQSLDLRRDDDLAQMCEQAFELACPLDDWEEAAIANSWTGPYVDKFGVTYFQQGADATTWAAPNWQALCADHDLEPYQREVFEHWIVSDWLADRLIEKGEKVDKDFAGMIVWARTTSGQGIASDSVIEAIAAEMNAAYPG